MAIRYQVKRATAAAWAATNPVLLAGEQALETDTGVEKIGDGATAYNSLPSRQSGTYVPRRGITTTSAYSERVSIRLGGATINTRVMLGVDDVDNRVFVNDTTNSRVIQSDDYGVVFSPSPRTLPTNVTNSTATRFVRFGAYLYLYAKDTTDNVMKVYRATPVARTADWADWSTALMSTTAGTAGFAGSMEKSTWATGTNYLFVAEYGDPTGGPALWRSPDGTTWTKVYSNDATMRHIHHVMADPYNPGHVWMTCGDGISKTVQRSTDSGSTWTTVIASSNWQAVQISFTPEWVWFAGDSHQGTAFVVDRATGTPYFASSNHHHHIPAPWPITPDGAILVNDLAFTSGSATVTAASAPFLSASHKGRYVASGGYLPPHTYITAVNGTSNITVSAVANATSAGRGGYVYGDAYYINAYWGAVDPATGVYYAAAMDTSSQGTLNGLFYLDRLGGRVEILDPGGVSQNFSTPIYFLGDYMFCGQWRRPRLVPAQLPQ